MTACQRCGRGLTDPDSIRRGVGPECIQSEPTLRQRLLNDTHRVLDQLRRRIQTGRTLTPRMKRNAEYVLQHPERFL